MKKRKNGITEKLRRFRKDCRGDVAYIDTVIGMVLLMLFIVLALNVYSFLILRQDLGYVRDRVLDLASSEGNTVLAEASFADFCRQAGIDPDTVSVSFAGTDWQEDGERIQYGDMIQAEVTCTSYLAGGGLLRIPVTVSVRGSSLSEMYYK